MHTRKTAITKNYFVIQKHWINMRTNEYHANNTFRINIKIYIA